MSDYLRATREIPAGTTRSFLELAALAGHPGGARAAGRALAQLPMDADLPWHRVVRANGGLATDIERARVQLERLVSEGARPRAGEGAHAWTRRVGAPWVAHLGRRVYAPAEDARSRPWGQLVLEPFASEAEARARGFRAIDAPAEEAALSFTRTPRTQSTPDEPLEERVTGIDWSRARSALGATGLWRSHALLHPAECDAILAEAAAPERFERAIQMGPKGYGVGEYRYWRDPLPAPLELLRARMYRELRPLAQELAQREFPAELAGFHAACRAAGQERASCILLAYPEGGVNHPHRDVYGEQWFPLQALVVLSRRGEDFEGGEFVLLEERSKGSELAHVLEVDEGDLIVFCGAHRLDAGRRIGLRHAMQPVQRGLRHAAGLVLNLAD